MRPFRFRAQPILFLIVSTAPLVATRAANAAPLVYDSISGVANPSQYKFVNTPPGGIVPPRSYMGDKINLQTGSSGPELLTDMTLGLAYLGVDQARYNRIQLQVKFYNSGSLAPETDVFSDPATPVLIFDVFDAIKARAPLFTVNNRLTQNYGYLFSVNLGSGVLLKDPYNVGVAFHFLGDKGDGNGLQGSDDLSLVARETAPIAIGSSDFLTPNHGYLRAATRTDFNFDQSDGHDFNDGSTNVGLALQLNGIIAVPEASTPLLILTMVPAALALTRRRRTAQGA